MYAYYEVQKTRKKTSSQNFRVRVSLADPASPAITPTTLPSTVSTVQPPGIVRNQEEFLRFREKEKKKPSIKENSIPPLILAEQTPTRNFQVFQFPPPPQLPSKGAAYDAPSSSTPVDDCHRSISSCTISTLEDGRYVSAIIVAVAAGQSNFHHREGEP